MAKFKGKRPSGLGVSVERNLISSVNGIGLTPTNSIEIDLNMIADAFGPRIRDSMAIMEDAVRQLSEEYNFNAQDIVECFLNMRELINRGESNG